MWPRLGSNRLINLAQRAWAQKNRTHAQLTRLYPECSCCLELCPVGQTKQKALWALARFEKKALQSAKLPLAYRSVGKGLGMGAKS